MACSLARASKYNSNSVRVSCEEDLIEAPFNDPNKYQATSHAGAGGQFVVPINNLAATHTYGINISPSTITFTLDANAVGSVPNTPACANQPMYLLANIAIGGWASNYANGQSSLPATMVISQIAYTGSSASGGLIGGAAAATAAVTGAASDPPPAATAAADPPAAASPAPAASAGTKAQTATTQITPGNGSVTDCAGNVWSISPDNKTLENGVPVLGGGDTSALTMDNSCTVYGLSNGNNSKPGWFTMSNVTPGSDQEWNYMGATATPPGLTGATGAAPATIGPAATTPTAIPPLAVQQCPADTTASGGFHVAGGQIIGPDGKPWIARGLDVHANNLTAAAQIIPTQFPGTNLVRVAAGDWEPLEDPSSFQAGINSLTSQGVVVEISDYSNSLGGGSGGGQGVVYTGALLASENAWFAAMATMYKNNPYVWLGTDNEPPTVGGSLSDWQLSNYQAIRGTGNNNIIFLETSGDEPPGGFRNAGTPLQSGMNSADYADMTNVVWDPHVYGYQNNYDTSNTDALVAATITAAQTIQSADGVVPVIIGEYGPGNNLQTPDPNGYQIVTSVINAGSAGKAGSGAWQWDADDTVGGDSSGNNELVSNGQITQYGQMVSLFTNTNVVPLTQCQQTAAAQTAINVDTAQLTASPPASDATSTTAAAATPDPTVTALIAQGDASVAQGNAIAAAAQAATQ